MSVLADLVIWQLLPYFRDVISVHCSSQSSRRERESQLGQYENSSRMYNVGKSRNVTDFHSNSSSEYAAEYEQQYEQHHIPKYGAEYGAEYGQEYEYPSWIIDKNRSVVLHHKSLIELIPEMTLDQLGSKNWFVVASLMYYSPIIKQPRYSNNKGLY